MIMTGTPFGSEIGDLEPNSVRILEERPPVIWCVFRIAFRRCRFDACPAKTLRYLNDLRGRLYAKADVMQPGRIGVERGAVNRRPQDISKVSIVVLNMRIAAQGESILAESQEIDKQLVIESLRRCEIGH